MSDQDIIDTIAVAVGRHEYWQLLVSEDWECACGETALFKVEMDQHIASTIAAALRERYAIVELPTGERVPCGDLGHCVQFDAPNDIGGVSGMNGTVSDSESEWTPDEARTLAAAFLAAADAAEASK